MKKEGEEKIVMDTVLGTERNTQRSHVFGVHCFPKDPITKKRSQVVHQFVCEDEVECEEWMRAINNCAREGDVSAERQRRTKMLFFINPFGGTKKALSIFERVIPMLKVAGVEWDKLETVNSCQFILANINNLLLFTCRNTQVMPKSILQSLNWITMMLW